MQGNFDLPSILEDVLIHTFILEVSLHSRDAKFSLKLLRYMLDSVLHRAALLLVEHDSDRLIRCLFDLHLHGSKLGIDA